MWLRTEVSKVFGFGETQDIKFDSSFSHDPLPELDRLDAGENESLQITSKGGFVPAIDPVRVAYGEYWDALKDVVYDLEVAEEELSYIKKIRRSSILSKEQIRMLHAKVFMSAISQFSADKEISDREVLKLRKLSECLQTLGVGDQANERTYKVVKPFACGSSVVCYSAPQSCHS